MQMRRNIHFSCGRASWPLLTLCLLASVNRAHSQEETARRPAGNDRVTLTSNQVVTGTIVADTLAGVKIDCRVKGAKKPDIKTYKAAQIRAIRYERQPMKYAQGLMDMRQAKYASAVKSFREAQKDQSAKRWITQYALMNVAQALHSWAKQLTGKPATQKFAEAAAAYKLLLKTVPNTRFWADAKLGFAECSAKTGHYREADAAVQELIAKKLGDEWTLRAEMTRAEIRAGQKKLDEAQKLLASVAQRAAKAYPDLASEANLRRTDCFVLAKRYKDAQSLLETLGREGRSDQLRATAYNKLGDCLWAQREYREALFAYLRVVVLFFKARDQHAKALYWAGKCFEKRGESARAKELYKELTSKYRESPWAAKLRGPAKKPAKKKTSGKKK